MAGGLVMKGSLGDSNTCNIGEIVHGFSKSVFASFRHITAENLEADMSDARKMQKRTMGCNNPPELVERFKCAAGTQIQFRLFKYEITKTTCNLYQPCVPSLASSSSTCHHPLQTVGGAAWKKPCAGGESQAAAASASDRSASSSASWF